MLPLSLCRLWQPDRATNAAQDTRSYTTARGTILSSKTGASVDVEQLASVLPIEPSALPSLELRDLRVALAKLPIEQREAILLVGLEGMDYEATASALNVPIGTVRSRLSRGRAELRKLMDFGDEPKKSSASHSPEKGRKGLRRAA